LVGFIVQIIPNRKILQKKSQAEWMIRPDNLL